MSEATESEYQKIRKDPLELLRRWLVVEIAKAEGPAEAALVKVIHRIYEMQGK